MDPLKANLELYRSLYRIRRVEERLAEVYPTDAIQSPMHLSIGQEVASVAVCRLLTDKDVVYGTYRGHALYLAKGGNLNRFVAELFGKATGCTGGWGGSMHLADPDAGVMACSAIVGSTVPLAVGHALANQLSKHPGMVASFFGDGATEEGAFYESLNFAALHQLPILFVCEDNDFAIHSPTMSREHAPIDARVEGILGGEASCYWVSADDGLSAVLSVAEQAVDQVLAVQGPAFLRIRVLRMREHVGPSNDWDVGYRRLEHYRSFYQRDAVVEARERILYTDAAQIEAEVEVEVDNAFNLANASPFPMSLEIPK